MKQIRFFLLVTVSLFSLDLSAQAVEKIVQANLDAYNKGDIEEFMKYISPDIEMYNMGECEAYMQGKEAVKERYEVYFKNSPDLHSEIKKRIVFDNKVIDHEYITGANGNTEPFELIFIYEVKDDLIVKTTSIRSSK